MGGRVSTQASGCLEPAEVGTDIRDIRHYDAIIEEGRREEELGQRLLRRRPRHRS